MPAQPRRRSGACQSWGATAFGALALAALVAIVAGTGRQRWLESAPAAVSSARPLWLWAAASAFAVALVCSSSAWRSALRSYGAPISRMDAAARYGVGALVNFFLPGHAGEAARVALFSRTLPSDARVWVASGVAAAVGAARVTVLAVVVLAATAAGSLPLWLGPAGAAAAGLMVAFVVVTGRIRTPGRTRSFVDGFRALGRSPGSAASLLGWLAGSAVARIAGVASVAAALRIHGPLDVAFTVVPALAVASVLQVTPANLGIASGAVALALHSEGVGLTSSVSGGLVLQGVETAVGLGLGLAGAAFLAFPSPAGRRWTLTLACGCAVLLAVAFGATTVEPLA